MFTSPGAVAFSIFGIDIMWYGVLIAAAVITAAVIAYGRAPGFSIDREYLLDILLWAIPCGIIGARAYYVIFNWNQYRGDITEIINFRGGGLAIHGGLIFGILAAFFVCKYHKVAFLNLMDLVAPSIAIGQAIGRWGNFFNSEAHGSYTEVPWAVYVDGEPVHPTFLYESIWCFLIFIFLLILSRNIKFEGQIICLYAVLYSVERFFVEALRTDSLMIGPFKQAQVISFVIIVTGILLYLLFKKRNKKARGRKR